MTLSLVPRTVDLPVELTASPQVDGSAWTFRAGTAWTAAMGTAWTAQLAA